MCWGRRRHHSFYFPHPQFLRWFRDSNWRPSNQKPASLPPILLCECSVCASVSTLLCVCVMFSAHLLLRFCFFLLFLLLLFFFAVRGVGALDVRVGCFGFTFRMQQLLRDGFSVWCGLWSKGTKYIDFIVHLSGKLSLASRNTINKVKDGLFKGYG